ncbi:TPA: hypothetical protein MYV63_001370 [Klebsiella pneumoniae]|nr:hypothetical protein [Klebsiella pneumoniae]HBW1790320.1 hypothetical protein [Klebsiella pneumoniae]HBW1859771.1 hypothetical protein [Klebsiella pneumoniae]HBW1864464.1 hypothetical protein [Klebsiella pneumoniae]HBW1870031.1 hypothetical protein [Klebsiella pneumoniae]
MKVTKFGTITTDGCGNLCVSDFMFCAESPDEIGLDPNDPATTIPVIANHLLNIVNHGKAEMTDFKVERIVSDALRKAKAGGLE